jgi:hypothetical protein
VAVSSEDWNTMKLVVQTGVSVRKGESAIGRTHDPCNGDEAEFDRCMKDGDLEITFNGSVLGEYSPKGAPTIKILLSAFSPNFSFQSP